jgi:hypothetical protein
LIDIAFQVYNNHNLEEERREQSKERWQAKLIAAVTGDAPKAQKIFSDKKAEKLSCFKCKKPGHMARNCQEPAPGPCHEYSKTGFQWHWRMDCPHSHRGAIQSRLWVYRLKPHTTEKAWSALNSPCMSLSSLMRNYGWP